MLPLPRALPSLFMLFGVDITMAGFRARGKLPIIILCLLVTFLYLKRGKQVRNYEVFLPNQEPRVVWDVLADFSNVAQMNTRV